MDNTPASQTQGACHFPEREGSMCAPPALRERRATVASLTGHVSGSDVTTTEVHLGGVRCLSFVPPEAQTTILHVHGGGYRLGTPELFAPFTEQLARASGSRVVSVDYRLAPEHPFPAALNDVLTVYRTLTTPAADTLNQRHSRPDAVTPSIVGDSAGGGLAAALTLACKRMHLPKPSALVLLSAWLDLRCIAESYRSRSKSDDLFPLAEAHEAARFYLQGWDPSDPLVSPLLGPLKSFPPTMLFGSTSEALLDDTLLMTAELARAGVAVSIDIRQNLPHAWPSTDTDNPESARSIEILGAFLRSVGKKPSRIH